MKDAFRENLKNMLFRIVIFVLIKCIGNWRKTNQGYTLMEQSSKASWLG